ncbi:MAG: hypothetical protein CMH76_05540 [Nitrospinae bacterium]|nr:hypothetical protein [Nitrospinota bacterium]
MERRVKEIMTTNVVTISLDEKLDLVDDIMSNGDIRHMPVTKGSFVIGLLRSHFITLMSFLIVIRAQAI